MSRDMIPEWERVYAAVSLEVQTCQKYTLIMVGTRYNVVPENGFKDVTVEGTELSPGILQFLCRSPQAGTGIVFITHEKCPVEILGILPSGSRVVQVNHRRSKKPLR